MRKAKGVSAWLITWEWSGNHARLPNKIAEILDPRLSEERVRQIVELLYNRDALLGEKIAWRVRHHQQPYPAKFTQFHGVDWRGEITCGHNPWLHARLVNDLIVATDESGKETASWIDRDSPLEIAERIRILQRGQMGGSSG